MWHQRARHVNYANRVQLKNITDGVDFKNTKTSFCEAYSLGKQHKIHSKEPATYKATLPGEKLHNNLFGSGNTLPNIGGYRYGSVVIDDATRTCFSIVLKTKDKICDKFLKVINCIKTETRRSVKVLKTDDGGKYERLQLYLDQKR